MRQCPMCGVEVPLGAVRCQGCGADLAGFYPAAAPAEELSDSLTPEGRDAYIAQLQTAKTTESRTSTWWYVGGAISILAVVALLWGALSPGQGPPAQTPIVPSTAPVDEDRETVVPDPALPSSTVKSTPSTTTSLIRRTSTQYWFSGGTLHDATVEQWKRGTSDNKLATAGDWLTLTIWEGHLITTDDFDRLEEAAKLLAHGLDTSIAEAEQDLDQDALEFFDSQSAAALALILITTGEQFLAP